MGKYKWEVSVRQYNDPKYPSFYTELLFVTNDISDVQDLKDSMARLSEVHRTEVVVRTVEVEDEV